MRCLAMARRRTIMVGSVLGIMLGAVFLVGSSPTRPAKEQSSQGSPYLFVWAGGGDGRSNDFLAVIDGRPESRNYAQIISTVSVNQSGTMPHHTEYEFPKDGILF